MNKTATKKRLAPHPATPRPWKYDSDSRFAILTHGTDVIRCNGMVVCRMVGNAYPSHGTKEGNAELICRAVNAHDDLLAACKVAVAAFDRADSEARPLAENWADLRAAADAARAAIAKAEGRS